jgi:hypothetical protein
MKDMNRDQPNEVTHRVSPGDFPVESVLITLLAHQCGHQQGRSTELSI